MCEVRIKIVKKFIFLVMYNYKFIPEVKIRKKILTGKEKTLRTDILTMAEVVT